MKSWLETLAACQDPLPDASEEAGLSLSLRLCVGLLSSSMKPDGFVVALDGAVGCGHAISDCTQHLAMVPAIAPVS